MALFPCVQNKYKDKSGSESFNPDGLMQRAIEKIKSSEGSYFYKLISSGYTNKTEAINIIKTIKKKNPFNS